MTIYLSLQSIAVLIRNLTTPINMMIISVLLHEFRNRLKYETTIDIAPSSWTCEDDCFAPDTTVTSERAGLMRCTAGTAHSDD